MELLDTYVSFVRSEVENAHPLNRLDTCCIGRHPSNDIVLEGNTVSRYHAQIRRSSSGQCSVIDLGGPNKTKVNGAFVYGKTDLRNGDIIVVGDTIMRFYQPVSPDAPLEGVARTVVAWESSMVSVLVIDIRGFSGLAHQLSDAAIADFIRAFNTGAGEITAHYGAWATKFIGDAVMAVWAHEGDSVPRGALLRVLDVAAGIRDLCRPLQKQFGLIDPIRIGCGIGAGSTMLGNLVGSGGFDAMPVGDTVNRTFRLESATKDVGCDVLIGQHMFDHLFPALDPDRMPPLIPVALKSFPEGERAAAFRFEDLGDFCRTLHVGDSLKA